MIRAGLLILLVGLSGLANGAIEEKVRKTASDLQERHGFPEATVAWVGPGHTARTLADPDSETPMAPHRRMLAASIAKPFVAAALLRAAEKDKYGGNHAIRPA